MAFASHALGLDAGLLRQLQQLAHARIIAPCIHQQSPHAPAGALQQAAHGVQAEHCDSAVIALAPCGAVAPAGSGTRSRSISPSTGFTDVTITRTCAAQLQAALGARAHPRLQAHRP